MYEDDIEYASRRLNNTLVRIQATGNPYYITRTFFGDNGLITHHGTDLETRHDVHVLHKDLNLEPVPLGFVNTADKMVYVLRKPMRRDWKQGLSHNSMMTCGAIHAQDVNMSWLVQPILKQYPSFQKALEILRTSRSSAFSRDFGVMKQGDKTLLRFRQHIVGDIVAGRPALFPEKRFLEQHLAEVI